MLCADRSVPIQTSERQILEDLYSLDKFPTGVIRRAGVPIHESIPGILSLEELKSDTYRELREEHLASAKRRAMTADVDWVHKYAVATGGIIPSFLKADLDPSEIHVMHKHVNAAILTSGGPAPGLNSVTHSIVKRLQNTYNQPHVFGVIDSFPGLANPQLRLVPLKDYETEQWQREGGSRLGCIRGPDEEQDPTIIDRILVNLHKSDIDILFVIGGDGSLKTAHMVAERALNEPQSALSKPISVVGIPKTMDNDILWVWKSFGFRTAVGKAAEIVQGLHIEARTTRRVILIELFGAEAGFVAANAALAAGCADLVLIPEVFRNMNQNQVDATLTEYLKHLNGSIAAANTSQYSPHAVVVLAEGVGKILEENKIKLNGNPVKKDQFLDQLRKHFESHLKLTQPGIKFSKGQPEYEIRSEAANAEDQIYCQRLGALAVDQAMAGLTDFCISEWLTEYVCVPLEMVAQGKKHIPITGRFWKQVIGSTGQPSA